MAETLKIPDGIGATLDAPFGIGKVLCVEGGKVGIVFVLAIDFAL